MNKIAELRKSKGWTQVELARKSGVNRGHLATLERGQHIPTVPTLKALAEALDCTVNDLL